MRERLLRRSLELDMARGKLFRIAERLARLPCRKGGTAVSQVRVQTRQHAGRWRCNVMCLTRRKKKSKETAGPKRNLAAAVHRCSRDAAELEAVQCALDTLQEIERTAGQRGGLEIGSVSKRRRDRMEGARVDAAVTRSGYHLATWRVSHIQYGQKRRKKKHRQAGQAKRDQVWMISPVGKKVQFPLRVLRGLQVQPGDALTHHPSVGKRPAFFTAATNANSYQ